MKITKEDIKKMEKVGNTRDGEVLHILTKGGFNMIVKKTAGGDFQVLGSGAHRSYARHQASAVDGNIQWDESLWKSEDMQKAKPPQAPSNVQNDQMGNPMYESSPQNHYDLAAYHSRMAGKAKMAEHEQRQVAPNQFTNELHDAQMRQLMHADIALKHYKMSGMDEKGAGKEHEKNMGFHHELQGEHQPPFQEYALDLAWGRSNPGKPKPKGLGYNWSE